MKNKDTEALWNAIRKMGRFSDSYYDKSIESEMCHELGVADREQLQELKPALIFDAFFKVMSPLSAMYEDILCLFEECKANSSSDHLEIKFEGSASVSAKFDIQHFIQAKKILEQIKKQQKKVVLNEKGLHKLRNIYTGREFLENTEIQSASYRIWTTEYLENKQRWPEQELDFENIIQDLPIRNSISKAYEFWKGLFDFYKKFRKREWGECLESCTDLEKELLMPERNLCLGGVLERLYYIAENYRALPKSRQEKVEDALNVFLEDFHISEEYVQISREHWRNFLKLPVWKKRYEIYSIWVFTRIMAAFPKQYVTYHVKDNTLIFPFSGACLASVTLNQKVFEIWTELRTAAIVKPVGRGRKRAVQPDYSIVCGNPFDSLNTVVAIECKQYKRANIKNFSEAIIDYAANRPNAVVLLADYGEVKAEMVTAVIKHIPQNRYKIFSLCKPQNKNYEALTANVWKIVSRCADVFTIDKMEPMTVILLWNGEAKMLDLDLVFMDESGRKKYLPYVFKDVDDAVYGDDIREGIKTERIVIEKWETGVYDLWVNNFGKEFLFREANPVVLIKTKGMIRTIEMGYQKDNNVFYRWHVLQIDTKRSTGSVINKIEEKFN